MLTLVATISAPINTFVSSGVNSTSVEAIGTASGVMMVFGVLISLLTGGAGIIISQYIGKKSSDDKMKDATDSVFLVAVIQGLIIAVLILSLNKVLLKSWGMRENTQQMKDGLLYIYMLAPTYLVISITSYLSTTISIYGHPKWTARIGVMQLTIDLSISYLLVRFTSLGIISVIIGTYIARFFRLVSLIIIYSLKVQRIWKIRSFKWYMIKRIIMISAPIAVEKVNYNIGTFVRGVIVGMVAIHIGLETNGHNYMIWSRAIFGSLQAITLIGSVAMSVAVENVVARMMGKGDFENAKKTVSKAFLYALAIDIPLALMIFFIQVPMIELLTSSEKSRDTVILLENQLKWTFLLLVLLEIGRAANMVYIAATRSAGDVKFTAIVSVPITWVFGILLGWILSRYAGLGWMGIVIAMTADECIRGIVNYIRWRSSKWTKHITKSNSEEDIVKA